MILFIIGQFRPLLGRSTRRTFRDTSVLLMFVRKTFIHLSPVLFLHQPRLMDPSISSHLIPSISFTSWFCFITDSSLCILLIEKPCEYVLLTCFLNMHASYNLENSYLCCFSLRISKYLIRFKGIEYLQIKVALLSISPQGTHIVFRTPILSKSVPGYQGSIVVSPYLCGLRRFMFLLFVINRETRYHGGRNTA